MSTSPVINLIPSVDKIYPACDIDTRIGPGLHGEQAIHTTLKARFSSKKCQFEWVPRRTACSDLTFRIICTNLDNEYLVTELNCGSEYHFEVMSREMKSEKFRRG